MTSITELPNFDPHLFADVPEHLRGSLERYLLHGIRPGGFMQAFLANDLAQALASAGDDLTIPGLRAMQIFLHWCAPLPSYGSRAAIEGWIEIGGQNGRIAA